MRWLRARPHGPPRVPTTVRRQAPLHLPASYLAFLWGVSSLPGYPGPHTYLNPPARGSATPEAGPVPQGTSSSSSKSSSSRCSRGLLDTWQVSITCGHRTGSCCYPTQKPGAHGPPPPPPTLTTTSLPTGPLSCSGLQAAVLTPLLIYPNSPRGGSDAGRAGGAGSLHPKLIRSRQR